MDVFISWSGERSRAAAEALHNWLPKVINAIKPWLSSSDIDKGARWSTDVASRLEVAKAGIICLTPSNLHADWILFEAGALSKTLQNTFVCPFLIGLQPSDVKPPLAQFQATKAQKDDVLKLLKTLNSALNESALQEAHIEEAFDVWWPKLESRLKKLPSEDSKSNPHRPDRELLEELLALSRSQNRALDVNPVRRDRAATKPEVLQVAKNWLIEYAIKNALDEKGIRVQAEKDVRTGGTYNFRTEDGRVLSFSVPEELPPGDIEMHVKSQLDTTLQTSRPEGDKSSKDF